ncbi:D-alanine--D-alanine ligase [Pseudomaricurvus alkylphenolicus]|jgi:D-alanine-D-alanine ligase|uniref:D-alanine--D-alanine ligase n=1 Tax=Pseudomaricurvus alkylphenolicus TaxID=1306991 RepID=UPI001422147A|nr:D-alanine--D-alanine ligase [Pseudomaricurvus alkylphenolicus]NIB40056.1 D-alanine--D-alanine ligase [Pseudomaricurvus alkylphenolicus]
MTTTEPEQLGRVAVLYGGQSAEREVSLNSGAAVHKALVSRGVDAHLVDVDPDIIDQLRDLDPARVFIALHGPGGEDGRMQALLEFLGLPYTGSGVQASALAMDKWKSKQIFTAAGISTPRYAAIESIADLDDVVAKLGEKLMIKPAHEGSSIGMTKVLDRSQLDQAFELAASYDRDVFAEALVEGAEYTVAILNGEALPAIKLETDHQFYDYDAKYIADDTRYICPCGLPAEDEQRLLALAKEAFDALGCTGWGRVDFMADEQGNFYTLEVNTVPGMTDHSLVPMAAAAKGLSFEDLVMAILTGEQ